MKKKRWIIIVCVVALAGGAWWYFKQKNSEEEQPKYEEIKVVRGDILLTIESTGVVTPQNRLELKPAIAGRLEEVMVNEGDKVTAGQIVAMMSSSERAALLDAARARGPEELNRWKDIYKPTPIIAPLDGTIIARAMEPGQTAGVGDTILVMADQLIIEAQVDETDLAQIELGQPAEVILDAYRGEKIPSKVSHIAYEAETVENVTIYKVQVRPDKMPDFVRSGMTASTIFSAGAAVGVLVVPSECIRQEDGNDVVSIPSTGDAQNPDKREVQVGLTDGKSTEIKSGLNEGDLVLAPKVQHLDPNSQKTNPFTPFGRGRPRGAK